jgi:hypothetical protein
MKVFDGFASPRWSEAEPGVGSKKMGVPGGGQQKPLTRNGVPIVSYFARRGDCFRGALSRMRGLKIENGIGMGHGFGMFVPFGDGFFWGRLPPGSLAPSARRSHGAGKAVEDFQGMALPGPLGAQLSLGGAWRSIISRGRLAYSCRAPCQTWLKGCPIPTGKAPQI